MKSSATNVSSAAIAAGGGVILVGSHLGAYIAGMHWLFRKRLPVRASGPASPARLARRSRAGSTAPKARMPSPSCSCAATCRRQSAIQLLVRARAALRDGLALYLCGDIPWQGPNGRPGRLLGQDRRFLAIWTELAVLTRAPVFHVFCVHLPGGRFRLELEAVGRVHAGEENDAVADYLKGLEARIATEPAQAVAHLLWPCFNPSVSDRPVAPFQAGRAAMMRPSRRNAVTAR